MIVALLEKDSSPSSLTVRTIERDLNCIAGSSLYLGTRQKIN
jgi:hypothetical protein